MLQRLRKLKSWQQTEKARPPAPVRRSLSPSEREPICIELEDPDESEGQDEFESSEEELTVQTAVDRHMSKLEILTEDRMRLEKRPTELHEEESQQA